MLLVQDILDVLSELSKLIAREDDIKPSDLTGWNDLEILKGIMKFFTFNLLK